MSLPVVFTDSSVAGPSGPITSWKWYFGDGASSTDENPTHDYDDLYAGRHVSVRLLVTGTSPDGTDSTTKTIFFPL